MVETTISLASSGVVKVPCYEQLVRFGYTRNKGVYRLNVTASGEWDGLTIRAFWHLPNGTDQASSLVVNGIVDVPVSVTAQAGNGCITFEGSDETRTVTSADLHYPSMMELFNSEEGQREYEEWLKEQKALNAAPIAA